VRLFGIQSQDLPRDLTLRNDERSDCARAQAPHGHQAMHAVRGPETLVLAGSGHRDDRAEEHAGAIEHIGELAMMDLR
jgi:hypothetical protein